MDLLQNEQASDPRLVAPLVWLNKIAATWGYGQPHMSALADRARMLLVRHHIQEEAIGLALAGFMCFDSASQAAEALFREALESNPHRDVQGRACYWLARFLHEQAESIPLPRATPSEFNLEREMEKRWGKEAVEALKAKEPSKLLAEAEKLLIRARLEYPDVGEFGQAKDDTPLEETAARYLHEVRHLMPGCSAPDIAGLDSDGMPLRLSDYRGNLILLENLEPQST